jgi:hypothetical protein
MDKHPSSIIVAEQLCVMFDMTNDVTVAAKMLCGIQNKKSCLFKSIGQKEKRRSQQRNCKNRLYEKITAKLGMLETIVEEGQNIIFRFTRSKFYISGTTIHSDNTLAASVLYILLQKYPMYNPPGVVRIKHDDMKYILKASKSATQRCSINMLAVLKKNI